MKTCWKISTVSTGIALAVIGFVAWVQADFLEWDLNNRVPTASVKDSKHYRVFAAKLEVEPREINLGGRSYHIEDVWLEHRTEPRRLAFFSTRQEILSELVLCVDIGSFDTQADVWIKDAKLEHILTAGANGVRFSEVGLRAPKSFSLCTGDKQSQVHICVKEESIP